MHPYHRILVCLDGSKHAPKTLAAAISLAKTNDAELVLFRSIGVPAEVSLESVQLGELNVHLYLESKAKDYLVQLAKNVPRELLARHSIDIQTGSPSKAICLAATEKKADLIVLGAHGYGPDGDTLGAVAAKVAAIAPVSVLIVR